MEFSYLLSAFNDIKWTNDGMGNTTRENTTNHTLGVVVHIVNVVTWHLAVYISVEDIKYNKRSNLFSY